jgi:hypothetical protein
VEGNVAALLAAQQLQLQLITSREYTINQYVFVLCAVQLGHLAALLV